MERIVKFMILVVLVAVAWSYGKPWLTGLLSSGSSSSSRPDRMEDIDGDFKEGDVTECIFAAMSAREAFGDIRSIGRSPDAAMTLRERLDDVLVEATDLCQCSEDGCELALEAVGLIDEAVGPLDDKSQIASAALGAARAMEQVDRLLEQATAEARRARCRISKPVSPGEPPKRGCA